MINKEEFEDFVYVQALENALQFKGKANGKALIGKCMPKFPEMKQEMGTWVPIIETITQKVNELSLEDQKKEILNINPDFFEEIKEKKQPKKKDGLPDLGLPEPGSPEAKEVVVRFEPAPSGYLHLGHLFGLVANYEIKKKYGGKFILRLADTNPDNIAIENYEKVIDDVEWICEDEVDEIVTQSKRLPIYHKYLNTLVEIDKAYVCQCDSETFKAYTDAKQPCPHALYKDEDRRALFEKFMKGDLNSKGAVVRFRADIEHKNPAMRTFSLARINTTPHPNLSSKEQHHVWPTMNLAVAVDDVLMGLTHVIRGKDHEINMERQKLVHKSLGMKSPEYFHFGRMKFLDLDLSKSSFTKAIEEGTYTGWDDPRVPSLVSYRKRGFLSQAFREYIKSLGISKRDSKITSEEYHTGLYYHNKHILERTSKRFFFVHNPKILHITNKSDIPFKEIELAKHPEDKSFGFRHIPVRPDYFIDSLDFDEFNKGDMIRLMHFGNFEILEKEKDKLIVKFISQEYDKNLKVIRNIHYVSCEEFHKAEITLQNNSKLKGLIEENVYLKPQESIQFERFGFVTFNEENDEVKQFSFAHR